ncbi:MAG: rhomboid family intramembrane serine protease [Anaerolineae bacterium]
MSNYPPTSYGPARPPSQPRYWPFNRPFFTYAVLVTIFLVWLADQLLGPRLLTILGAIDTRRIIAGEVWRLFTAMFLHADLAHLFFNGYALFIFGIEMEHIYGGPRFISIYTLSGLFGSLASFALRDNVFAVGASGAIFGVIGMNLAFFLMYRDRFGEFGRRRLINTLVIIAINILFGLSVPRIDNLAHIGGLVAGFGLGYGLSPRYRLVDTYTAQPRLIDTVSLLKRIWVLGLASVLFVGGLIVALALH